MLTVGLTGNIASGKSAVAQRLVDHGAYLIDADVLARHAVAAGSAALAAIADEWGNDVLRADGTLDRTALRDRVFGNPTAVAALNAIVHPEVERLRRNELARAASSGARVVVCDIPLLFERGLEGEFDVVVLVHADDDVRLKRLTGLRNIPIVVARDMMAAQWPSADKRARADIVIENNGTLDALLLAADALWQALNTRTHGPSLS